MKNGKLTLVLYAAGGTAAAGLLFVYFWSLFAMGAAASPGMTVYLTIALGLYLAAFTLYFLICRRIGEDRSFSQENGRDLGRIAWTLWAAAVFWLCGIPFVPPSGRVFGFLWPVVAVLLCMASAALGALAWVLSRLVRRAADLQDENDLTV